MPIYEYGCLRCDKPFEKLVRAFREEVACPKCGSASVERLLSTFAMSGTKGAASSAGSACGCGRGGCGCGARH